MPTAGAGEILQTLLAVTPVEELPVAELIFQPLRLAVLVVWVYLCVYCVSVIENYSFVSKPFKPVANIAALFIGPVLLIILGVIDLTNRIQSGQLDLKEAIMEFFGNPFKFKRILFPGDPGKSIQLLDASGRSFAEVYGSQKDQQVSREIQDMTEGIMLDSIVERASDILIDPTPDKVFNVRFRVDGYLRVYQQIDEDRAAAVVNSIKAISNMDIAEKRRPQDGSFMARVPQGDVHFRVNSQGVLGGEKLSIRVLNRIEGLLSLKETGMSQADYDIVLDAVAQSSGMIVVCGPTGSGKTTSLYAMLKEMDFFTRNVVTVEDPIEYMLPNVSQIEVNPKANITFANALRSILRQDPDVIVAGEIRDPETASMAIQASQTGHLVLATLHASSNMACLVRLLDLQIKPLLIASAVSIIISQRLVRKLCPDCKSPAQLEEKQRQEFIKKGIDPGRIMQANGCENCHNSGYIGRIGLFDVTRLDENIKNKLVDNTLSMSDMKMQGDKAGRSKLKREGMRRVLRGETTLEEVKRVISNLG